jgi:hypothetical protein
MLLNKDANHLVHFQYFRCETVPITNHISLVYWFMLYRKIF